MVATTMIGNVSAVPPEARHAKRLLGLLGGGGKTPALAGRALLSAVAAFALGPRARRRCR